MKSTQPTTENQASSSKPAHKKQIVKDLNKELQESNITFEKFTESINNLNNKNRSSLLDFFNQTKRQQENIDLIIEDIQSIEEPYKCNYFKLKKKGHDNEGTTHRELEIANAGLTVFMANTNHGKTLFSINLFCQFLKDSPNNKAAYISVEEEQGDILNKVFTAYYAHTNRNKYEAYSKTQKKIYEFRKEPDKDTIKEVLKQGYIISQSEFEKRFKGKPFNDKVIIEYCKILASEGYKTIFLDYVQDIEMEGQRNKAFNYELKDLIRSLNTLAISQSISIILNAQTASEANNPKLILKDVGDSYDIVRKAKAVYAIWDCSKPSIDKSKSLIKYNNLYSYRDKGKDVDNKVIQEQDRRDFLFIQCLKSRSGLGYYANAFKYNGSQYFVSNEEKENNIEEYKLYGHPKPEDT